MIKLLDGVSEKTIAFEITDGYQVEDEKALEVLFEKKLAAGITKINMLAKIDDANLTKSSWKAMMNDSIYALKHIKNCRHIAIVGHSSIQKIIIEADSLFGNKKADLIEKYFDIADYDKALEWVGK